MADPKDLTVIAPSLPPGSCVDPSIITLMAKIRVLLPGDISFTITGANEPSSESRDYVWTKIDSDTNAIIGQFTWSGNYGSWIKRHFPSGVPNNERRLYVGSLSSLETYDGGEPGTVSDITGPFWVQDTNYTDAMIVGAGSLAVETNETFGTTGANYTRRGIYVIKPSGRIYDRG